MGQTGSFKRLCLHKVTDLREMPRNDNSILGSEEISRKTEHKIPEYESVDYKMGV